MTTSVGSIWSSNALVSVVVPAYNAASTIGETLKLALAQTHANIEIIVVDDGSTDETANLVASIVELDPRVNLVRQQNLGVAAARNAALALARGAFVAPLDADDLWHPEKIERQLRRLSMSAPDAGVVYCWSVDIDASSLVLERRLDLDRFEGDVYAPLVLANFIGNASVPLIRRADIEAIGGWDQSLRREGAQGCEDWQVYLRLAERTDFVLEPAFLVGYRQTQHAMSRQLKSMRHSYDRVLTEARSHHPELPAWLFRWSKASFDFYAFELASEHKINLDGLLFLIRGIARDPKWIARRSTRRKFRRWIKTRILKNVTVPPKQFPKGAHFSLVPPAPPVFEVSEGKFISARRALASEIKVNRHGVSGMLSTKAVETF